MNYDPIAIGKRIRTLRKACGFRQGEIATACLITDHTGVSKIERGEQGIDARQIMAICDFFKCSPEFLLYGKTPDVAETDAYRQLINAALKVPLSRIDEETRVLEARYGLPTSPPQTSRQPAPPLDGAPDSDSPDADGS